MTQKNILRGKIILISTTLGAKREDYSDNGKRISLEMLFFPVLKIIFLNNDAELLQPFIFFSCNLKDHDIISENLKILRRKLASFSAWPKKYLNIECEF